jgi:molybdopterin-guanine dinucleotide biosynthesis protein A
MSVTSIVPVRSKAELQRFIRLPAKLYASDPHFIPPLEMERMDALTKKNPYFEHAEAQFFLAVRDGRDVGRISAQVDSLTQQADLGYFGLLAAENDPNVFAALFEAAEQWLRAKGKRRVQGPFNLSINEETGLLIDGFDTPPIVFMPHDPRYAAEQVEGQGYGKAKDVIAYLYDMRELPASAKRLIQRHKPGGMRVRHLDFTRYDAEFRTIRELFNDAWSENWGFIPFTQAEFDHLAKGLKPFLDAKAGAIVEVDGQPVGFGILLPNINEAIRDFNGRLLPFNWLKLIQRRPRGRAGTVSHHRQHAHTCVGARLPGRRAFLDPRRQSAHAQNHRSAGRGALQDVSRLRKKPRVSHGLTALVLAGTRAGGDPLAAHAGVSHKALIQIGGRTMLERVVSALVDVPEVARVVVAIERPELVAALPAMPKAVTAMPASSGPSASVAAALDAHRTPMLVTTADHALLRAAWISEFLSKVPTAADAVVALARKDAVTAAAPNTQRTYLRFADGDYSGCNLFLLSTPAAGRVVRLWQDIEAQRKRPVQMLRRLGIGYALRYRLGRLTLAQALGRLGELAGDAQVSACALNDGRAAIDVDKPADLELVRALAADEVRSPE